MCVCVFSSHSPKLCCCFIIYFEVRGFFGFCLFLRSAFPYLFFFCNSNKFQCFSLCLVWHENLLFSSPVVLGLPGVYMAEFESHVILRQWNSINATYSLQFFETSPQAFSWSCKEKNFVCFILCHIQCYSEICTIRGRTRVCHMQGKHLNLYKSL